MKDDIKELLRNSSLKTDILLIAFSLIEDQEYSQEDTINDLINLISKHDL
ncbi:hypothetical protein [Metabacillus litoralis]|nr:hypothetical protein [Metabacillus litoralis]MCM3411258.1 hypothetical protein [Metabacillus litoralis]